MIKIFVITLSEAKERQASITSAMNFFNLPFEFIYGLDGRKLTDEEINLYYDPQKAQYYNHKDLSRGEIGCASSHRLIYKRMTEENIPKAVVLEDDAQFDINFSSILVLLEKIKINNYIIKLDRCTSKQTGNDNRLFTRSTPWHRIKLNDHYIIKQPLNDPKLTTGYYIDIKAAHTMLLTMAKIFMPADNWKYFRFFIKLRFLNTAVVWSNIKFESIIGPERYREKADKSKNNTFVFTRPFKKFFLLCRLLFH